MKKRHQNSELLDRVADCVLEASRLQNEEIEKVITAPHLFDSVRERIEAERSDRRAKGISWTGSYIFNWKTVAVAGILGVSLIGAISFGVFTRKEGLPIDVVDVPAQIEQPKNRPPIADDQIHINSKVETPPIHRRAVSKANSKQLRAKRQPRVEREEVSEFYALTYAGDRDNADEDGQIVRVDLPRSSLFAMGIDLPVENDTAKITADLLIGSDGVMRAVRIVN